MSSSSEFRLFMADAGRGASAYAVAMEIVHLIAEFGGAIAALGAGVRLTKRVYEKLRDHLGRAPVISLGTACFLAAADLIERTGHEDFYLHGAGDTRRRTPDHSYTGNDCFYVIFERENDLYFYAVDAYGKITFLGTAQMPSFY